MNDDYLARFGGISRLFGSAALARLSAAHVCVVGVGGVGSWTVEGLARSGIGALTLIDLDDVCLTNVNRQVHALDGQVGRAKVEVLAERVRLINPVCRVMTLMEFFTKASADRMLETKFDYMVDAIAEPATRLTPGPVADFVIRFFGASNKALLLAECQELGRPVLTVGGAAGKRDATKVRAGDLGDTWGDGLLRTVRRKLRREHGFKPGTQKGKMHFGIRCIWSSESPAFPWADGTCRAMAEPDSNLKLDCATGFGTAAFVTGAFGLAAAGEVVRLIAEAN